MSLIIFAALILLALAPLLAPRLRSKRFYIVRHGQTILNAEHIKQGEKGPLSPKGQEQARAIAEALKPLGITIILASPYERTVETAGIIAEGLHAPVRYSPLLAERKNPSEVIGKRRHDPEVVRIVDKIDLSYHDDAYRYSDEENFLDLKMRARKALRYLARAGAARTCVVTHHAFLKMLLASMLYRERLHAGDFVKLSFFNVSDNGGVSIAQYRPWRRFDARRGWRVESFNEVIRPAD